MGRMDFTDALTVHLEKQSRKWQPQVAVRAPHLGIDFRYGIEDLPFHSASVGKLITAALIMQLVEKRELACDTPVVELLGEELLQGLFAHGQLKNATIEHLLTHTSGINDYFTGRSKGPSVLKKALRDLDRRWTPLDLVAHTRDYQKPVGEPGQRFFYSDTGFILLGLVLESVLGAKYQQLVHDRIFQPLAMNRSFMPLLSKPASGTDEIAPLYIGNTRVDGTQALSIDWSGGGIAATVEDYLTLIHALRSGDLIANETWEWMAKSRHKFRSGMYYGAGTMNVKFSGLAPWLRGWPRPVGHQGITSTHLLYDPVHDAEIVINFGSSKAIRASFATLIEIVGLLRKS